MSPSRKKKRRNTKRGSEERRETIIQRAGKVSGSALGDVNVVLPVARLLLALMAQSPKKEGVGTNSEMSMESLGKSTGLSPKGSW